MSESELNEIRSGQEETEERKKMYNEKLEDKCPLCGEVDNTYHFLRCQSLHRSPRGERGFKKLKSDCAKLGVSPLLWDIYVQASKNNHVSIPPGTDKKHQLTMQMLIGNQKQLGWENFLVGRICYDWSLVQKMVTSEVTSKCDAGIHLFWRVLFGYYCQLWRDRCFYASMLQREEEHCLLDIEITNYVNRDWSGLARSDRELRMHTPKNTATTAIKKG